MIDVFPHPPHALQLSPPQPEPEEDELPAQTDPLAFVVNGPMLDQLCGRWPEELGPAGRLRLGMRSAGVGLILAGTFGAAMGCSEPALAVSNAIRLPLLLVLTTAASLPVGLLSYKLADVRLPASDMLSALGAALFTGGLVLGVASPFVPMYFLASPMQAITGTLYLLGTACLAALLTLMRLLLRVEDEDWRLRQLAPVTAMGAAGFVAFTKLWPLLGPSLPSASWMVRMMGM